MNFLRRIVAAAGWPLLITIALFAAYLTYSEIREWRQERAEAAQNQRNADADKKAALDVANAEANLAIANGSREVINGLKETVGDLSTHVQKLAQQERIISVRVDAQNKSYEDTRTQNRSAGGTQPDLDLREREQRALATDAELYAR